MAGGQDGVVTAPNFEDGLIFYQNPTTGSKIVYSSFGLETISQEVYYYLPGVVNKYQFPPFYVPHNQRSSFMHNIVCYLRTGTISGEVHSLSAAGAGVPGTVVTATNGVDKNTYTGTSDQNGNFQVSGLPAGRYTFTAYKAGFSFQHNEFGAQDVHGGDVANLSLVVSPTSPGNVTVTVDDATTSALLANVSVTLTEVASGNVIGPVLTTAAGTATFFSVPTGNYNVIANGSSIGYAVSAPSLLSVSNTANNAITIPLQKTGATLSGFVTLSDPGQPDNGSPVAGAAVTLTGAILKTVASSPSGAYLFSNLQPGTYRVEATKASYGPSALITVPITAGASITEPLQLTPAGSGGAYHRFSAGLQMISVPYDYTSSQYTLQQILGSPSFKVSLDAYLPSSNTYAVTPQVPCDTFRLGQGYWTKFPVVTSLTKLGAQSTSTTFPISLIPQWNMIGDPFTSNVPLANVLIQDQEGNDYSFAAASGPTVNLIGAQIYSYDPGTNSYVSHYIGNPSEPSPTLQPYVGYWVEAYAPLTFIVPNPNSGQAKAH